MNQTLGEAVSGRMNFLWETQGSERCERQPTRGAGGALPPSSLLSRCTCLQLLKWWLLIAELTASFVSRETPR